MIEFLLVTGYVGLLWLLLSIGVWRALALTVGESESASG